MKRNDFENMKESLQKQVGIWKIVTEKKSLSDFVLGCFYDLKDNKWKVYINNEKGRQHIRLQTDSEDIAFDRLLSMVKFEIENNKYNRNT